MRRVTATALLVAVLISSLPWELAGLILSTDDTHSVQTFAGSPSSPASQEAPPEPDQCFCLCMGCPGSAVETFAVSHTRADGLSFSKATAAPLTQMYTSDVLSRLFRPPRSA